MHGNVTEENIDEEQSTRNAVLMRLLEDLHMVENRGTGIRAMIESMRRANLEPPRFHDKRSSFWVIFRSHSLMDPESALWLQQFAAAPLNDRQRLALVYLRHNERMANDDYRRLNRVDGPAATSELRGLVQSGLVEQQGVKRGTFYVLKVPREVPASAVRPTEEDRILALVRDAGAITNADCQNLLNVNSDRANHLLKKLVQANALKAVGSGRWRKYVLP
jgi:ATP-dependent DNA helicase RecG